MSRTRSLRDKKKPRWKSWIIRKLLQGFSSRILKRFETWKSNSLMIQGSNRRHFRLLFRKESLARNLMMFLIVLRLMKKRRKKTKKRNLRKFRRKKKVKEIFKNSIKLYFIYLLFLRLDLIQSHFTISLEYLFGLL